MQRDGVHDERVAFPVARRVSGIGRIVQDLGRRLASIQVDAPQRVVQFAEERDLVFRLHHFHAVRHGHHCRHARRQTLRVVVELVGTGDARFRHHLPLG